jgi:hypothetical protein
MFYVAVNTTTTLSFSEEYMILFDEIHTLHVPAMLKPSSGVTDTSSSLIH